MESIIETYEYHPSIKPINEHVQKENNVFDMKVATIGQINIIIKDLNFKKATGPDKILVKL